MSAAVVLEQHADHSEIRAALALYEDAPGLVSVMYLQAAGAVPTWTTYDTTPAELDRAARDVVKADHADEPLGVYVRGTTVRPGTVGRGVNDDTVAWLTFRADLDLGKDGGPTTWLELFAVFETANLPTPTYWQHSGGGYYPVWQLAERVDHAPEVEQLARDIETELRRAWNAAGHTSGVDSCHDAARVWRLAGSVHRKNPALPVVSTIGKVSGEVYTLDELRARVPAAPAPTTWEGDRRDVRRGTAAAFERTYTESLDMCRTKGKAYFRHTFFAAARNAHRMVGIGLRTDEEAMTDLADLVAAYWPGVGPNGDDRRHVHDALHNPPERGENGVGALASPWELLDEDPAPAVLPTLSSGDMPVVDVAPTAEELERRAVERLKADERRRRLVRRELDEEEREPAPDLAEFAVWDDALEQVPAPTMAIKQLVPERAVGWLGGPSGSYKSFVASGLAVCLAYGVTALGHHEFTPRRPRKVLYVAGEGSAGVALRLRALRARLEVSQARQLALYPRAVDLTSADAVERMAVFALGHGIEHIIIDTFRQSTLGVNENDNTEVGLVLSRLLALRDEHGIGSTLVDHTNKSAQGLADLGGAGAKRANADYVLMVDLPNGSRAVTEQRTLRVAKLKDSPDGQTWPIRLEQVDEVCDADGTPSAVVVVGEVTASATNIHGDDDWRTVDVPDVVRAWIAQGKEGSGDLSRVAQLAAHYGSGESGVSRAEVVAYYRADTPGLSLDSSRKRVARAWDALLEIGVLEGVSGGPTGRHRWVVQD